jgi:hypothetical protein
MLHLLDRRDVFVQVLRILEELMNDLRRCGHTSSELGEHAEEFFIPRDQAHVTFSQAL